MRKIGTKLFIFLALVVMTLAGTGSAFAQSDAVTNYTFPAQAEWLDDTYFARVGGAVHARSIPTDVGNSPRFTFAAGNTVEVTATVDTGTHNWLLVRGWDTDGYMGFGWVQETAARLTEDELLNAPVAPACYLDKTSNDMEFGEQWFVTVRFNEGWTDDATATSCNLFYEGRIQETNFHHYWSIRDTNAAGTSTITSDELLTNGMFWLLEGTGWVHPTDWAIAVGFAEDNTGQMLEHAPMISFFAMDKQGVMSSEGYHWPFVVHQLDGTELNFAYGAFGTTTNTVNRCELDEPRYQNITGIYNNGSFRSASVGAEGCMTIIFWQLPSGDYQLLGLMDTDENLEYKFQYGAYLIPSDWDSTDIGEFVLNVIVASAREGTEIEVVGIDGMSNFSR